MLKQTRKIIVSILVVSFIGSSIHAPVFARIDPMPYMPKPGVMVPLSPEFTPAYLKGIVVHPEDPLKFDFIIYKGDKPLTDPQKKEEYTKLTKYFLASLAIPDDNQWVNLSPYEKDRIIKDDFGKTEMGRDLLAQDYMLKQITASLIYPEDNLGKKFWSTVYAKAQQQYGTTNIPVNTFNKVWILPDDALIYEKGNTAYILRNHLRVMLEEDYLSLQKHSGIASGVIARSVATKQSLSNINALGSKIVRQIVLPELQREVNEDKNFAALRQVYSGMLLATWFKRELRESLLGQIYANKAKVKGVDQDPKTNEEIYRQYLKAYKKGVFNFIKEDVDKYTNETVPRKYFSGGSGNYSQAMLAFGHKIVQITRSDALGIQAERNDLPRDEVATVAMYRARAAVRVPMTAKASRPSPLNAGRRGSFNAAQTSEIRKAVDHFKSQLPSATLGNKIDDLLLPIERTYDDEFHNIVQSIIADPIAAIGRNSDFVDEVQSILRELNKVLIPRGYLVISLVSLNSELLSHPGNRKIALLKITGHKTYKVEGKNFSIFLTSNVSPFPIPYDEVWRSWESHEDPYGIIFLPSLDIERDRIIRTVNDPNTNYFNIQALGGLTREQNNLLRGIEFRVNELVRRSFPTADPKLILDELVKYETLSLFIARLFAMRDNVHPQLWKYLTALDGIGNGATWYLTAGLVTTYLHKYSTGKEVFEPNIFKALDPTYRINNNVYGELLSMMGQLNGTSSQIIQKRAKDTYVAAFRRYVDPRPLALSDLRPNETESLQAIADKIRVNQAMRSQERKGSGRGAFIRNLRGSRLGEPDEREPTNPRMDRLQTDKNWTTPKWKRTKVRGGIDSNAAMINGGIDLNSANLSMLIKRDGKGVVLPLAQQDLAQLSNIEGLDPVILSIKPASQTPLFSHLQTSP